MNKKGLKSKKIKKKTKLKDPKAVAQKKNNKVSKNLPQEVKKEKKKKKCDCEVYALRVSSIQKLCTEFRPDTILHIAIPKE